MDDGWLLDSLVMFQGLTTRRLQNMEGIVACVIKVRDAKRAII